MKGKTYIKLVLLVTCSLRMVEPAPTKCDPSKHQYDLQWNSECPSGTEWNEAIECCVPRNTMEGPNSSGCHSIYQSSPHWDGKCPLNTKWNSNEDCCIGCRNCTDPSNGHESGFLPVDKSAYDYPQADDFQNKCDGVRNLHRPYDGKECPPGTSWNEKEGCCEGCPLCAPGWRQSPDCLGGCIPCERFYFSSNPKNNEECLRCTNCTALNRYTLRNCTPVADSQCGECFRGFQDLDEKHSYMSRCTQLKKFPDAHCDHSKGYFPVPHSGICPPGTGMDVYMQCCLPCHKCPPGYKHAENCLHRCKPCPKDTYSDQVEDNPVCHPCLNCHAINRLHKKGCQPIANAECGACLFGYYENLRNTEISCLKCHTGNPEPQCEEFLHRYQEKAGHGQGNAQQLQVILPCVTAVAICIIVIASLRNCCGWAKCGTGGQSFFPFPISMQMPEVGEERSPCSETRVESVDIQRAKKSEIQSIKPV